MLCPAKHPVIAVTGSSGAGTTTVKRAFENIFRRENIKAAVVEGDSLHSLDRMAFRAAAAEAAKAGNNTFSHFGPEANHFDKIEGMFKQYGETGMCQRRYYVHSDAEAVEHNKHFNLTDLNAWRVHTVGEHRSLAPTCCSTKVCMAWHKMSAKGIDARRYVDLGIGVVPVVNLEWIQKIHRDKAERGYSAEATVDTIMRRMPDYIKYITPQFTHTDINFQRVATVDTSNPFIARDIPTPDESFVIIRFRNPKGVDFPYYLSMIPNSFMSRANTMVVPGGKMSHAMEVILSPIMHDMIEKKKK